MLLVFVLFWLVLGWGLYDTEIYPKEAAIFAVLWFILAGIFFFMPQAKIASIIGMVLVDIVLLAKTFARPAG